MKLESFTNPTKEVYLESKYGQVVINTWSNGEGANFQLLTKDRVPMSTGSLTWEELDILVTGLAAARSV